MIKKPVMVIFTFLLVVIFIGIYNVYFLRVHRNISYGDNSRQTMDLYVPKENIKNRSLIVFVYGGAWRTGSKNYYGFMGRFFANRGYPTLIPDYRLYPEVQFPLFVDDVAQAIKKAESVDALIYDDIILIGHSAGGHTAALLATDPFYFSRIDIRKPIKALIGLSAPYDLPFDAELTPIFEPAINQKNKTNPISLVNESLAPTLLLHGNDDVRVGLHHTQNFTKKLQDIDVSVETHFLDNYSHATVITSFLPIFHHFTKAPKIIIDFLN